MLIEWAKRSNPMFRLLRYEPTITLLEASRDGNIGPLPLRPSKP